MKVFKFFFGFFLLLSFCLHAKEEQNPESMQSCWRFVEMSFDGTIIPPRDPNLVLLYEFKDEKSRLFWTYNGGEDFCERKGEWHVEETHLVDQSLWINPNNAPECYSDVDMQPDRKTFTEFHFNEEKLYLNITLSGQDFFYIWKKEKHAFCEFYKSEEDLAR